MVTGRKGSAAMFLDPVRSIHPDTDKYRAVGLTLVGFRDEDLVLDTELLTFPMDEIPPSCCSNWNNLQSTYTDF